MRNISRRTFLTGLGVAAISYRSAVAQNRSTRLILLGTGGGPRPRKASSASAQVIVSGDAAYVIDCGNGVARQLAFAAVPLTTLRHVFVTHQHSDHNADYGNLVWLAWSAGLATRVDTWGPPTLEKMTDLFSRTRRLPRMPGALRRKPASRRWCCPTSCRPTIPR